MRISGIVWLAYPNGPAWISTRPFSRDRLGVRRPQAGGAGAARQRRLRWRRRATPRSTGHSSCSARPLRRASVSASDSPGTPAGPGALGLLLPFCEKAHTLWDWPAWMGCAGWAWHCRGGSFFDIAHAGIGALLTRLPLLWPGTDVPAPAWSADRSRRYGITPGTSWQDLKDFGKPVCTPCLRFATSPPQLPGRGADSSPPPARRADRPRHAVQYVRGRARAQCRHAGVWARG